HPIAGSDQVEPGWNGFFDDGAVGLNLKEAPVNGDFARINHCGRRHEVMQISELIMGNEIKLDVLEQLTLNPSNFSNCLPVPLMVERHEVETRPFRKQGIRRPKRGAM